MTQAHPSIDPRTARNAQAFQSKPVLAAIYRSLFARIAGECRPGRTVEIGAGGGAFKAFRPDAISGDIAWVPWLDLVFDGQALPFADRSIANLVLFDVFHHLEFPGAFLAEAQRVLMPGGRIVMAEPAITPASWPFYHFIHEEPVDLGGDPLATGSPTPGRDAFAANQALPSLLAGRYRAQLTQRFPTLRIARSRWLSLFVYPLSGGFKPWCLIPRALVWPLLALDDALSPMLGRLLGFRILIVIERA